MTITKLFTATHATTLLAMLNDNRIGDMGTDQINAVLALRAVVAAQFFDVDINVPDSKFVEGIKMIRIITGLGLKEAKDMYDRLDPQRNCGRVGPIVVGVHTDGLDDIRENFKKNGISADRLIITQST